jgi:hypothetical protein
MAVSASELEVVGRTFSPEHYPVETSVILETEEHVDT